MGIRATGYTNDFANPKPPFELTDFRFADGPEHSPRGWPAHECRLPLQLLFAYANADRLLGTEGSRGSKD